MTKTIPPSSRGRGTKRSAAGQGESEEEEVAVAASNGLKKKSTTHAAASLPRPPPLPQQQLPSDPAPPPATTGHRINVIELNGKSCTHEALWPPNDPRALSPTAHLPPKPPKSSPPKPSAKAYPFPLDPFQRVAIDALESGHSVLVAAHTSAGKTVVAEYAFAMAIRDKSRAIYTSPLKALSNQKYRELAEEFKDVGLLTGDVTINPNASCLVMTTEILRSMLYAGSDVVREASLIVFDEVHYLRDAERGVVWEEAISLAPPGASLAFLSATLPNAAEFATWVAACAGTGVGVASGGGRGALDNRGSSAAAAAADVAAAARAPSAASSLPASASIPSQNHHRRPCHVVYTEYRPTPLQMYVFPAGGDGLFLTVDEKGTFKEAAFAKAIACLEDSAAAEAVAANGGGKCKRNSSSSPSAAPSSSSNGLVAPPSGEKSDIFRVVKMVVDRRYDPLIVFSFSKRDCEAHAASLAALDLNSKSEAESVAAIFWAALDCLAEEDRKNLPQVSSLLPALRRGVGVHHSGLLPILKEVVELLFQEGLVKVLFATETFSTGLNMPAKTVVFTGARKFDGGTFRWLTGGEFTQMAGRAGRRGLDDKGVVILVMDSRTEPPAARAMVRGAPDPLASAFRLSYGSLLAMARSADASPEQLLASSFAQWQARAALPELARRREEAERAVVAEAEAREKESGGDGGGDELVAEVVGMRDALAVAEEARRVAAAVPSVCLPFLRPGRLARLAARGGGGDGEGEASSSPPSCSPPRPACWGVIVRLERVRGRGTSSAPDDVAVDVLCRVPKKKREKAAAAAKRKGGAAASSPSSSSSSSSPSSSSSSSSPSSFLPIDASSSFGELTVASLRLSDMAALSSVRIYLAEDLRPAEAKEAAARAVAEIARRFSQKERQEEESKGGGGGGDDDDPIPLLDPVEDMGLDSEAYRSASARAASLREALRSHPLSSSPDLESRIARLRWRRELEAALSRARALERDAAGMFLGSELRARVRVLRKLGYLEEAGEEGERGKMRIDGDGDSGGDRSVVTVKGRAAAELSSAGGAELALAEALFGGGLSGMRPEHLAALLSCLVWQEPSSSSSGGNITASAVLARVGGAPPPPRAPEALDGPLAALRAAARRVARVERDVGLFDESGSGNGSGAGAANSPLPLSPDDAAAALLSTEPADAVLAWARGARFVDALRLCGGGASSSRPAFEGSLVRALRRVDELLRQLGSAAEVFGDENLAALAKAAGDKVRRGVPFAPSLYL